MYINALYVFLTNLLIVGAALAEPRISLTQQQKLIDFEYTVNVIKENYVFLDFKQNKYKFDFQKLTNEYKEKIANSKSDNEFSGLLHEFVANFKDAHINIKETISSPSYEIPLFVRALGNQVYVESIRSESLGKETGIQEGDEVVEIDNKPVLEYLPAILKYINYGNARTNNNLIWHIFYRPTYIKELIPQKANCKISLKNKNGEKYEKTITWKFNDTTTGQTGTDHKPQKLTSVQGFFPLSGGSEPFFMGDKTAAKFGMVSIKPSEKTLKLFNKNADMNLNIFAVIYKYDGKNILLFRSANYNAENVDNYTAYLKALMYEYAALLDIIVIDQTHNNGGINTNAEKFIALFANNQTRNAVSFVKASRYWLEHTTAAIYRNQKNDLKKAQLESIHKNIENAILQNQNIASLPFPILGFEYVKPYEDFQISVPILMLIDENSGSYGDVVPYVLKENKIAKLFGVNTMGAGGNVEAFKLPSSRLAVGITTSIFDVYKPDGQYDFNKLIENNGVSPDFYFEPDLNDLRNDFQQYVKAFSEAAVSLTK